MMSRLWSDAGCVRHQAQLLPTPHYSLKTFFDIPWLFFSPSQPLFFYEFPVSTSHFTTTTLPLLKHSLSLSLSLLNFYPLSGTLLAPPRPSKPQMVFAADDFVLLTAAESTADFLHLTGDHPRDIHEFHPLVPQLPSSVSRDKHVLHLLSVQVTLFPNSGICVGFAFHQAAADKRTFNLFLKSWASICRSNIAATKSDITPSLSLPSFDRSVIRDDNGIEDFLLEQLWSRKSSPKHVIKADFSADFTDVVRATFVVGLPDMERIKRWITARCSKTNQPLPVRLSSYVLTCAYVWVCLIKAQQNDICPVVREDDSNNQTEEEPLYFGFIAGGITRLKYPVPQGYFGNCIAFGKSTAKESELVGEDGVVVAARAVASTIKELDDDVLGGAERWISDWEVLFGSDLHVMVVGSPKVDLYETDFGWGRPKKIEEASIDGMGAISLTESRELKGRIEVGLVLPQARMLAFASLFNDGLRALL